MKCFFPERSIDLQFLPTVSKVVMIISSHYGNKLLDQPVKEGRGHGKLLR